MSIDLCVEYGLAVTGASYEAVRAAAGLEDPDELIGFKVGDDDVYVEAPYDDKVFLAFGECEHGRPIPKEPKEARKIRAWFRKRVPNAVLTWGVLIVER